MIKVELRIFALVAALAAALATGPAVAQQDFSKVDVRTEKLSATTYMLMGAGGNLGLSVGPDAVFLVDDDFAPLTPKIEAAVAKLSPKPVGFVINTSGTSITPAATKISARSAR